MIVGIDLSLTGLGLAAVPSSWDLEWLRIRTMRHGAKLTKSATEAERIARVGLLADGALGFCRRVEAESVWIEGYPISGRVYGLAMLAELGGVVRDRLTRAGYRVETAPISTARKIVLGKLPRRDVKSILHTTIRSIGAPAAWSGDELDAWVAANYGATEIGACCIVAPGVAA